MNYYAFHIGDFRSGTVNMSRIARWIYRDMLDVYYDSEHPLPLDLDTLCDQIGVEQEDERRIVERLLRFKFAREESGYRHPTCDRVIAEYHAKAETARKNGQLGGRPKGKANRNQKKPSGFQSGSDQDAIGNPVETGSQANQEPITKNQEPETKVEKTQRASRLPSDWKPSEEDLEYCKTQRPELDPASVTENFRDYWLAKGGADAAKRDWPATWRTWVRNERAPQDRRTLPRDGSERRVGRPSINDFGNKHGGDDDPFNTLRKGFQ